MSTVTEWEIGADSMPEIPSPCGDRREDVDAKHARLAELLEQHEADAILLQEPLNLSWLSSGGEFERGTSGQTMAAIFVTSDARVIVTDNASSAHIFEEVVPELGFQLKERSWQQPRRSLLMDLCRGRRMLSDDGCGRSINVAAELAEFRSQLSSLDRERLLALSRMVVHAVEATARTLQPGQTELELTGEIAHRLIKRRVRPLEVVVHADGAQETMRNRSSGKFPLERFGVLVASGRRWGLTAAAARTVCFGEIPDDLREAHEHVLLLMATAVRFSQPDWPVGEVWKRVQRIYEKFGHRHEWRLAPQGALLAGDASGWLGPGCEQVLKPGLPVYWSPGVGPALGGDTLLVGDRGAELLQGADQWPVRRVEVKGLAISCPAILQRTRADS